MSERQESLWLLSILSAVTLTAIGIAATFFYSTVLEYERGRLTSTAQGQARSIERLARLHTAANGKYCAAEDARRILH